MDVNGNPFRWRLASSSCAKLHKTCDWLDFRAKAYLTSSDTISEKKVHTANANAKAAIFDIVMSPKAWRSSSHAHDKGEHGTAWITQRAKNLSQTIVLFDPKWERMSKAVTAPPPPLSSRPAKTFLVVVIELVCSYGKKVIMHKT